LGAGLVLLEEILDNYLQAFEYGEAHVNVLDEVS
jgi:hypothetical protein